MHIPVEQYDYIIVGGGSAGATLAARLCENPLVTVCLIEAGPKDTNPLIHIPFGLSLLSRVDSLGWGYFTEPQESLYERELFWPRGKTLGGSSSVNAMCYIRGDKQDYDRWQEQGAKGWDFASVLPYFKKSEHFYGGADDYHGSGGPLQVNKLRHTDELSDCFVKAASAVGLSQVNDFNREQREGLGLFDVTQVNGQRCSSAKAYLSVAKMRQNLTIKVNTMAERVLLKNRQAIGVQIRDKKGRAQRVMASSEVVLSGGAINSPHLLMLSGIGPKDELQEKGIHVQLDLPGVGQNLQDHLDTIVQYKTDKKAGYAMAWQAIPSYILAAAKYAFKRQGLLSSNIAEAGGFVKSSLATQCPDIQFHFLPAILQDHGREFAFGYGYGLHVCALYPKSRGRLTLQSNHPADHPLIDPRYLTHDDDWQVMIEGIRLAKQLLDCEAFAEFNGKLADEEADLTTDDGIKEYIRHHAETIYHPIGTCKIGEQTDPMAVVDAQLRVHGVNKLRVVDASVMPSIIGGNTNAATIMIAERAADFIKLANPK